ncbi:hypothetical protein KM043_006954 [Ampulex compressa]|nr:hypothetical protein KM043_006954 [Ampulex compressa]
MRNYKRTPRFVRTESLEYQDDCIHKIDVSKISYITLRIIIRWTSEIGKSRAALAPETLNYYRTFATSNSEILSRKIQILAQLSKHEEKDREKIREADKEKERKKESQCARFGSDRNSRFLVAPRRDKKKTILQIVPADRSRNNSFPDEMIHHRFRAHFPAERAPPWPNGLEKKRSQNHVPPYPRHSGSGSRYSASATAVRREGRKAAGGIVDAGNRRWSVAAESERTAVLYAKGG